jgi:hypothetical protein
VEQGTADAPTPMIEEELNTKPIGTPVGNVRKLMADVILKQSAHRELICIFSKWAPTGVLTRLLMDYTTSAIKQETVVV